jgi:hypothetical protein
MMRGEHAGDAAELYALGCLSQDERRAVEAHVQTCSPCLRRIGEAEETLLALERETAVVPMPFDAALFPAKPRRTGWWPSALALAAAFVFGMLVRSGPAPNPALDALATSHFNHAQFSGANEPKAKVLYARDRSWYYVVVTGSRGYDVYGVERGVATRLGTTRGGELFAGSRVRFDRLELRERGRTVESAAIR